MGRYVRVLIRALARRPDVALTLLVRDPRATRAYAALADAAVATAPLQAARGTTFDAVWYPWNAVRFAARAPSLVTINDDFAFRYPARGFIARRREQGPIERAVRSARRFATISQWSRDELSARFARVSGRIDVIPLAPNPFFVPGIEASEFSEPFVLAVGAGEARKNIPFLMDACGRAFPHNEARLVIVGTPDAVVRARCRATRLPVTLRGSIDDAELRRLYRTAAVVAVPSLAEGFGLVATEAQACGAAVIAAATSALPEAVGDAGICIDPADISGWSAALRSLVADRTSAAELGRRAAARWSGRSASKTLEALLVSLERTIDGRT